MNEQGTRVLRSAVLVVFSMLLFAGSPAAGLGAAAPSAAKGSAETGAAEPTRLAPVPPLSLADCVRLALEHNPGLSSARKEQAIQALERPRALSSFFPTLDAEGSYVHFQEKQRVVPAHRNADLGVFDEDFLEGGLVLRLPIFHGGKRVAAYRICLLYTSPSPRDS